MIVEVCANSFASAKTAQLAGARRIELCQNLMVGGLTPSPGTMQYCKQHLELDILSLIRPRSGDFCYSEIELHIMCRDILYCNELEMKGVVVGALNIDGTINMDYCKEMKNIAGDMAITFHRAFDFVPDPFAALDALIELGYDRVLTSGQQANAFAGRHLLKELVDYASDKIIILAGGGINANNVLPLVEETGLQEVHLSAKELKKSKASYASELPLNSASFPEHDYYETSVDKLNEVMGLLFPSDI